MPFIKVGETVINTDSIVAVELARTSIRGKTYVVVTVTVGGFRKTREFWFAGEAASSLRAYFTDPNNVIVLLSRPEPVIRSGRVQRVTARELVQHLDFEPPFEEPQELTNWDDEDLDIPPPDDPPPPPTIRRRPWEPRPPDPLSAAASVEPFNPPIP